MRLGFRARGPFPRGWMRVLLLVDRLQQAGEVEVLWRLWWQLRSAAPVSDSETNWTIWVCITPTLYGTDIYIYIYMPRNGQGWWCQGGLA